MTRTYKKTGLRIKIAFSHFETEAVYLFISFETPAGIILIDPRKHYSYGVIYDMDNCIDPINEWLKNDSEKLNIGSYEELFSIESKRFQHTQYNEEVFLFTMSVQPAFIWGNKGVTYFVWQQDGLECSLVANLLINKVIEIANSASIIKY